jgi:hypothetical protein
LRNADVTHANRSASTTGCSRRRRFSTPHSL